jgi:hypothetical protein
MLFLRGPIGLDQLGVNVVLKFGVEGAQATILPITLILLGVLVIAQPVHRIFYGVIALAISVYSIAGVNLGGWVLGFLLGVIGGVIVVSWAPPTEAAEQDGAAGDAEPSVADGDAERSAAAGDAEPASSTPGTPGPASSEPVSPAPGDGKDTADGKDVAAGTDRAADDAPAPQGEPGADTEAIPRTDSLSSAVRALSQKSAAVVVASALALGGTSLPATTSDATASGAQSRQDDSFWCVVLGVCDDDDPADPSASPSATPSPGTSEPGSGQDEDPVGDAIDDVTGGVTDPSDGDGSAGDGTGDGQAGTGDGTAGGGDSTGGTGPDGAAGDGEEPECQEPTQDGEVPPEAGDSAPSDPCGEIDPQETIEEALRTELGTCVKVSFGGRYDLNVDLPGQCGAREDGSVFSLPADLESRDLTIPLTGINGIGLANVPVKNDGSRRDAIKISADKVVVDGFWLKSYAYDHGTTAGTDTRADSVSLEGNAHMYVSSIHANLPDGQDLLEVSTKVLEGASLIELLLTATDARMGFLGATSDVQVWDGFREQVWGDPTDPIGRGPAAGTP